MSKHSAAIVGSGNIGTDLMYKLIRSKDIEPHYMIGIDPYSEGLSRAKKLGLESSHEGVDWLLKQNSKPDFIFEATSAHVHIKNEQKYKNAGVVAIDLTPAACGPYVIPPVNLTQHISEKNLNLVTCGGQATIPMVHAVSRITDVNYAEIVATVASRSAGPGTRQNIDEFTRTTAHGVEILGGANEGKAIIILNPAEPPLIMRDTIYCSIPNECDKESINQSIYMMEKDVQSYVPGYRLISEPQYSKDRVAIFIEVEGAGDYLPKYAGNLDIMTASAIKVGEEISKSMKKLIST
ncbi:MAG: acetaldehyde dehydrogenase (acetylating) [Candidatus Marinimicrobia bacterium]|nr:acetaldehyde dehydrogenase (acetylating) [Candidatus Neomarinimicrobiota bacterium]|tara:strand:+ start:4386 stop:5267 length:882 start_codon:yes stop_codon:yes gene_type:complete